MTRSAQLIALLLVVGMLGSADPRVSGRHVEVASVLDAASARVEQELGGQTEVEAAVLTTLGTTYQGLGLYGPAKERLQAALVASRAAFGVEHVEVVAVVDDQAIQRLTERAGGAFWFLTKGYPLSSGTLQLKGLRGPVRVIRDQMGVPSIYATNTDDLFFAQGYVHAQDRLWQMELFRHIGHGRTAELQGKSGLENDKFLRTIGLARAARADWQVIDEEGRRILLQGSTVDAHHTTPRCWEKQRWSASVREPISRPDPRGREVLHRPGLQPAHCPAARGRGR